MTALHVQGVVRFCASLYFNEIRKYNDFDNLWPSIYSCLNNISVHFYSVRDLFCDANKAIPRSDMLYA